MSVWDTFSASFQLVQEKLEQVLDDSATTAHDEEQVQLMYTCCTSIYVV